jgi:hypothetical protein
MSGIMRDYDSVQRCERNGIAWLSLGVQLMELSNGPFTKNETLCKAKKRNACSYYTIYK